MDVLLLWDFSPGRAVAAQVRRKFASHSPSLATKEFFLVAFFPYSSFPLSEDAVSVVLECCFGGMASGFRVTKVSDRRFRFSVASNKVGHFVYSLKERVWSDFHCVFSLFRGDGFAPCFSPKEHTRSNILGAASWVPKEPPRPMNNPCLDRQNLNIVAISPKLDVLKENAFDGSFNLELAKFGFSPQGLQSKMSDSMLQWQPLQKKIDSTPSCSSPVTVPSKQLLMVGDVDCSFLESNISVSPNSGALRRSFIGHNFRNFNYWLSRIKADPDFTRHNLECVRDLRQAVYPEFEIQRSVGLWGLPPQIVLIRVRLLDLSQHFLCGEVLCKLSRPVPL
jgi:hypothetical protein